MICFSLSIAQFVRLFYPEACSLFSTESVVPLEAEAPIHCAQTGLSRRVVTIKLYNENGRLPFPSRFYDNLSLKAHTLP